MAQQNVAAKADRPTDPDQEDGRTSVTPESTSPLAFKGPSIEKICQLLGVANQPDLSLQYRQQDK